MHAASCAPNVIKEEWCFKCKRYHVTCYFTRRDMRDWPPRSPDITPCDSYLWRYVKDQAYQPAMPQTRPKLRERISQVRANVDESQLRGIWEELEYRVDACRVINGA
jgi:hypothetical protein